MVQFVQVEKQRTEESECSKKIKQGNNGSKVHEGVWFWQFHFKLEQGTKKKREQNRNTR